jgi:hypothetical protein
MSPEILQIILMVNIFFVGVIVSVAVRHAYAHFRPHPEEKDKKHTPVAHNNPLPPEVRERILNAASAKYQTILNKSADDLQVDLKNVAIKLTKHLDQFGTHIISEEMNRYDGSLDNLRKQAEIYISNAQKDIAKHEEKLKANLNAKHLELEAEMLKDIEKEKEQLSTLIDQKLSDAVASFLIETLQHDVDLGSQSKYLTSMLEEHKSEIIKGLNNEA